MTFGHMLGYGQAGESAIAMWLRRKGWAVLPVYEKIIDNGKGPHLFLPEGSLIAPDLFVFNGEKVLWIEAKHKTAFSWHRISSRWVTGIDLNHYEDYKRVDLMTPWPVWLMFLHEGGQAKDSPPDSPSGLFGNKLEYLKEHENHQHQNHGRYGMVYWALETLYKLAELREVCDFVPEFARKQRMASL